jgi:hypothetical protein
MSITGEKFSSSVLKSTFNVSNLFDGKVVNLVVSLTLEATILGVW